MRAFFSIKIQTDKEQLSFNVSASPTKDFQQYNFKIEDAAPANESFTDGTSICYFPAKDSFEWAPNNKLDKILPAISDEIRRQKLRWRHHV